MEVTTENMIFSGFYEMFKSLVVIYKVNGYGDRSVEYTKIEMLPNGLKWLRH